MKRRVLKPSRWLAVLLLVALVGTAGCGGGAQPERAGRSAQGGQPAVIKIGGLVPLNGPNAHAGASAVRGMELAVREINNSGGIKALGGARLELVKEDSPFAPDQATKAVEKLLTRDRVVAIIGGMAGPGTDAAVAASQRIPGVWLNAIDAQESLVQRGFPHYYQMSGTMSGLGRSQVAFLDALNKRTGVGMKKAVALLYGAEDLFPLRDTWVAEMAKIGIPVAEVIAYPMDWADPTPYVNKIKAHNPDVVLMMAILPHLQLLFKAMKQVGIRPVTMNTIVGLLDAQAREVLGDLAEGGFSVAFWNHDLPEARELVSKFQSAYPDSAPDAAAALHYQAVRVLARALEQAQSAETAKLSAALRTVQMSKAEWVVPFDQLTFDGSGLNQGMRPIIVQVQGGKYKTVFPEGRATASPVRP